MSTCRNDLAFKAILTVCLINLDFKSFVLSVSDWNFLFLNNRSKSNYKFINNCWLFQIYKSHHLPSTEAVVMAIKSILLPQDDNLSTLQKTFPVTGDGNTINNVTCRVIGELQTRACMVLASYLNDLSFSKEFIQHCGSTIDVLKSLAKECNTGYWSYIFYLFLYFFNSFIHLLNVC